MSSPKWWPFCSGPNVLWSVQLQWLMERRRNHNNNANGRHLAPYYHLHAMGEMGYNSSSAVNILRNFGGYFDRCCLRIEI